MRVVLFLVLLTFPLIASPWEFSAGRSLQPDDVDLSLTVEHFQVEYIDEGGQQNGIMTRDRPLNIDFVESLPIHKFNVDVFAKAGVTSSIFSTGCDLWCGARGFPLGENFGFGTEKMFTKHLGGKFQWVRMHYQQVGYPAAEWFNYASLSAVFRF